MVERYSLNDENVIVTYKVPESLDPDVINVSLLSFIKPDGIVFDVPARLDETKTFVFNIEPITPDLVGLWQYSPIFDQIDEFFQTIQISTPPKFSIFWVDE